MTLDGNSPKEARDLRAMRRRSFLVLVVGGVIGLAAVIGIAFVAWSLMVSLSIPNGH